MEYRTRGEEDTALGIFREEGDAAILGDGEGDSVGTMQNEGDDLALEAKEEGDLILRGADTRGVGLFLCEDGDGGI